MALPLLGLKSRKTSTHVYQKTWTRMFKMTLFRMVKMEGKKKTWTNKKVVGVPAMAPWVNNPALS